MDTAAIQAIRDIQAVPRLLLTQRRDGDTNVLDVVAAGGRPGRMVARQERTRYAKIYEPWLVLGGPGGPVVGRILVAGPGYTVVGPDEEPVGTVNHVRQRLLRRRWQAAQPGLAVFTGRSRGFRRLYEMVTNPVLEDLVLPFRYVFSANGHAGFQIRRRFGLRSRYVIDLYDPYVDRRLALAQLIALRTWE
jgi:hypothetical protein